MQVRNLRASDTLPLDALRRDGQPFGFESLPLDPSWVWVGIRDATICCVLVTTPAHGLLFLLRMSATPEAPAVATMLLLRRAFSDARRRGLLGYVTFLSDSTAVEAKLMRIVQRSQNNGSGGLLPASGVWAYGRF